MELLDVDARPVAWREAGSGRLILFLHGLGGTRTAWDPQLRALSNEFRCVAWDMPGYGASPLPDGELTWDGLAASVLGLIDRVGAEEADIVGLSLGGMIAQHTVLSHPGRVRSLTLLDTSPRFGLNGTTTAEQWVTGRLEPLDRGETPETMAEDVISSIVAFGAPREVIEEASRAMRRIPVEGFRRAVRLLPTHDVLDRLSEIRAPTLVAVGELDEETPPSYSRAIAEAVPNARLEVIAGAGHYTNLERPEEVNTLLRVFLHEVG